MTLLRRTVTSLMRLPMQSAVLVGFVSTVCLANDQAMENYRDQLDTYFSSIHAFANRTLDELHSRLDSRSKATLPRQEIALEIRSGADGLCFNRAKFKVGASSLQPRRIIVVCEPDLVAATEIYTTYQFALAAEAPRFKSQIERFGWTTLVDVSDMKAVMRRRIQYYSGIIAKKKLELNDAGFSTLAPCMSWQLALQDSRLDLPSPTCSRRDVSEPQEGVAAKAALNSLEQAAAFLLYASGTQTERIPSPTGYEASISGSEAIKIMRQIRGQHLEFYVKYIVAHELAHLVHGTSTTASLEQEIKADLQALSWLDDDPMLAMSLPIMTASLDWLWSTTGQSSDATRAQALMEAVYCIRPGRLASLAQASAVTRFLFSHGTTYCSPAQK